MAITGPARTSSWRGWLSSFSLPRHSPKEKRKEKNLMILGNTSRLSVRLLLIDPGEGGLGADDQMSLTWLNSCRNGGQLESSCPWMKTCLQ